MTHYRVVDMQIGYSSIVNNRGRVYSKLWRSQRYSMPPTTVPGTQSTSKYPNTLYRLKRNNKTIKGFEIPNTYPIH